MKKAKRKFPLLKLESNCTVRDAAQLKDSLLGLCDTAESVVLDVAAVERIETASLQLLSAFVAGRRAAGRAVTWRGDSAAMSQAVTLSGLSESLGFIAGATGSPGEPARVAS